jgi:hypothetical protein
VGFDPKKILAAGQPGRYSAGGGLSLLLRGDRAYWEFQFRDRSTKKTRTATIGAARGDGALNLTAARAKRDEVRAANRAGALPPRNCSTWPSCEACQSRSRARR